MKKIIRALNIFRRDLIQIVLDYSGIQYDTYYTRNTDEVEFVINASDEEKLRKAISALARGFSSLEQHGV